MTACVNKNYKRRAAGVVTASLVGALTLGGVSLAVATPALAAEMELQSAWTEGVTLAGATDGKGAPVDVSDKVSFAKGSGKYLVPTAVKSKFGDVKYLTDTAAYTFTYTSVATPANSATASKGSFTTVDDFFKKTGTGDVAGTYKVTVTGDGGFSFTAYFTLEERTLAGAKASGELTYTGASLKDALEVVDKDGNKLSSDTTTGDYAVGSIALVSSEDTTIPSTTELVSAGTYKVTLNGKGDYAGTSTTIDVKVGQLDLSKAAFAVADVEKGNVTDYKPSTALGTLTLNGQPVTSDLSGDLVVSLSDPDNELVTEGGAGSPKSGPFTLSLEAKKGNGNMTGSATVSFTRYDVAAGDAKYDGSNFNDFTIDLTKGEAWDESKLVFMPSGSRVAYAGATTVSYYDLDAKKAVDASALKVANKDGYQVTIKATATKNEKGEWVGGYATAKVTVKGNELQAGKDVAFYLDGEAQAGTTGTVAYDGTDKLGSVSAKVVGPDGKAYEQGKDFELVVKKGGKEVSEAVDAGTYVVSVKGLTFELDTDAKFDLTVAAVQIKDGSYEDKAGQTQTAKGLQDQTVYYTGSDVAMPAVRYLVYTDAAFTKPKLDEDKNPVYATLDASLYNVVSIKAKNAGKVVTAMKDADEYTVTIALSDAAKGNYQLAGKQDFTVTVKKAKSFTDVSETAWYAGSVATAWNQFYVNGISGTNLFAPENSITRADAVGILFNMAGGDSANGADDFKYSELTGYDTGFNDVDGKAYYAKALAWAHKSGVVNGNGGAFRPTAEITREEFAAMLFNYAKSTSQYTAAEGDALSKVSDADTVSGWATEAVNWAVSNKVMGNGGKVKADQDISRAEVAAMAVNFQPENLDQSARTVNGVPAGKPGARK